MAKTATAKTALSTRATKTNAKTNMVTTAKTAATTTKTTINRIEKMYTQGIGPRRIGKELNMPRHSVMRIIEGLGLFTYAEGSYR